MKIKKIHITKKLALGVASFATLVLTTGIGAWAYTAPYSYVSLDVNPSIEYTLNRFERVIDVKAVNDDGQVILDEIDIDGLNHQSIEDAILETVEQISKVGYFSGDTTNVVTGSAIEVGDTTETVVTPVTGSAISIDGGIVITISNGNSDISQELVAQLREVVENFVTNNVEVEVSSVGYERVQEARLLGVTPGKLNLVQKLQASSANPDSIVLEDWLNKPVKDIMKAIKANKKATPILDVENEEALTDTSTLEENETTNDADVKTSDDTDKDNKKVDKVLKTKAVEKAIVKKKKTEDKAIVEKVKVEDKAAAELKKAEDKAKEKLEKTEAKAKDQQEIATAELEKAKEKVMNQQEKVAAELEKTKEKVMNQQEKVDEKAKADQEKSNKIISTPASNSKGKK